MSYNSDSFLRPIGSNKNIKIFNNNGDLTYTIKPTFITSILSNGNILNITLKTKLISLDFVSYDEATSAEVKLTQQVSLLLENNEYSDTSIISFINELDVSYSYDKFLRPLTDTDRNIKILDNNGIVNFTIDPFSIININTTNNLIKINVKSSKIIVLDFSSTNEAKVALERLREQIDILTEKVPLLIDKDIQIFITDLINTNPGPTGYSGSSGTSGTSGIGFNGTSGSSGTSGTSGIDGTSGTSSSGFYGTSSTELKMPIYGNIVEIQTQSYLGYSTDQWVIVSSSSEYAVGPYYDEFTDPLFYAIVDDYNNETGLLNLVCQYSTLAGITFSQWFINLSGAFKNLSSLGPLPVPKVKLQKGGQNIEYLKIDENLGNTVTGGTFELKNYPVIIAQDLTDIQINLGANRLLFVEMVHYRRKTNKNGSIGNSAAGYVTAGTCYETWPEYLPWPSNFWTRNNSAKNYPGGFVADTPKDRQNYFPINYHNEKIPVYNMLHNRFHEYDISYRDINLDVTLLNTIIPSIGYNKTYKNKPTYMFSYSPYYTPYYIAFRYIIYNTYDNKIISGPLSEIVKITHQYHPFRTNYISSFNSSPYAEITNLYNRDIMQCWMVRKR